MKKIFSLLIMTLCLFMAGCSDEENDTTVPQLGIDNSGVIFTAAGGTGTIELKVAGATATADKDWFTVSVSGKTITVTASPNTTISGRTGQVIIKQDGLERTVPVTQTGNRAPDPEMTEVMMPIEASETFISVASEMPFTATTDAEWLTTQVKGDTLILKTTSNKAQPIRHTTVTLSAGTFSVSITVTQDGIVLIPETTDAILSNDGETLKIAVETSGNFTVKSNASWLTVAKGSNYVTLTTEANPTTNPRNAVVTLSLDGYNVEINVVQRLYIYTDYLGTWRLDAKSKKDGSAVILELTVVEKVKGSSYLVYGWGGSSLATDFPITMDFTAANGTIKVDNQENIGTDKDGYQVGFTGATSQYSIITGTFTCIISQRTGNTVTWITQSVQSGPLVGVGYHFKKPDSWYSYNVDPVTTDMKMTKISSSTSGMNIKTNSPVAFAVNAISEE